MKKHFLVVCLFLVISTNALASKEVDELTKLNAELIELNKKCAVEIAGGPTTTLTFEKGKLGGKKRLADFAMRLGYTLEMKNDFGSNSGESLELKDVESLAIFINKELKMNALVDFANKRIIVK